MLGRRQALALIATGLVASAPARAQAESGARHQTALGSLGRPKVRLDRLDFPKDVPDGWYFRKHLTSVLRREVRRVEWGAGRDNVIEYRFAVTGLDWVVDGETLRVSCTASGTLPGSRSAKSQLSYGGSAQRRNEVVKRVLEIVARGVVTRLAELERQRRGLPY